MHHYAENDFQHWVVDVDDLHLYHCTILSDGYQCMQWLWYLLDPCRELSVSTSSQLPGRHTYKFLRKAQISIVTFWIMLFIIQLVPDFTITHSDVDISDNTCNVPEPSVLVTQISVIILIFITMLFLMIKMMLIIRKSLKNLFQGESSAADLHKQRSMKKKAKLTTLFSIIALGFIISWAPIIAASALDMICPACVSFGTIHIMSSFIQLNSCVSFIVYAIKNKNFKTVCLQIIKCKPNEVVPLCSTGN